MTGYNTTQNRMIASRAIISVLALAALAFSGMAAAEQLYVNESGWWRDGGAFNADYCNISGNNAHGNEHGIYLSSSNNTIYHNNLINNPNSNAYDNGHNTRDNGYPSGSNYYSDYNGTDNNTDDIGATSYLIPGGISVDHYPLMEQWTASADATPGVTITAPVSGSIVNTPNMTVTGFATDDVGIVGMGYAHDWEESSNGDDGGDGSGSSGSGGYGPINASTNVSINWTVYLQNGTNTMRVTAVDEAGNSGNASVTVIYDSLHGAFTTADAVIALEIAVGSRPPDSHYDVSGDGSVTSLDALMILQAAVGSIEIG